MRGIRLRSTILVTLTLAVALVIGGVVLTAVLRNRLTENLDTTLSAAASDRAAALEQGADPAALTSTQLQETLIWIGTADGTTLASGGRATGAAPVDGLSEADVGTTRTRVLEYNETEDGTAEINAEEVRLAIGAVGTADSGLVYVVVASELDSIDGPVGSVVRLLVLGSPVLLALVAGLTWVTADRALRPVELIRTSAEAVRSHRDGAVIDVPSTGDEIERLATTVNQMLTRLARSDRRQRQFVGDASHELKSPLANLRIDVETGAGAGEQKARHLGQIDRLTAIVDDLLALASHDEDQPIRRDLVDLDDVVFDVIEALDTDQRRMIDFDAVTPTRVTGDAPQLRRLVRNLVDNAARHAVTQVAVSLSSISTQATLHVDDDGPGVPAAARETIFERFTRSDSARDRHAGGTGLGLAIVSQIAEGHNGTVTVGDSPLGGARFTVTLRNRDPRP